MLNKALIAAFLLTTNHLKITQAPSPNFFDRTDPVQALVIHYTASPTAQSALNTFKKHNGVSAHYTIDTNGTIYQHVPEDKAALHAGYSNWNNLAVPYKNGLSINNCSIGIELVSLGYHHQENHPQNGFLINGSNKMWYPFTKKQIESLKSLSQNIVHRYTIPPYNVIGHFDIAPGRKLDPGPLLPWKELAKEGIGIWHNQNTGSKTSPNEPIDIQSLQIQLHEYGYDVPINGICDKKTHDAVQSFHMHFRPHYIGAKPDKTTISLLKKLLIRKKILQKYHTFCLNPT